MPKCQRSVGSWAQILALISAVLLAAGGSIYSLGIQDGNIDRVAKDAIHLQADVDVLDEWRFEHGVEVGALTEAVGSLKKVTADLVAELKILNRQLPAYVHEP